MTLLVFTVGCKSNKNAPDGKELVGMSETEFRRTTEIGIDCLKQNYSSKVKSGEIQSVYEVYLKEKEKQNQIITNYTSVDIIDIYLFL